MHLLYISRLSCSSEYAFCCRVCVFFSRSIISLSTFSSSRMRRSAAAVRLFSSSCFSRYFRVISASLFSCSSRFFLSAASFLAFTTAAFLRLSSSIFCLIKLLSLTNLAPSPLVSMYMSLRDFSILFFVRVIFSSRRRLSWMVWSRFALMRISLFRFSSSFLLRASSFLFFSCRMSLALALVSFTLFNALCSSPLSKRILFSSSCKSPSARFLLFLISSMALEYVP
mmetsp:Transcript_24159/g.41041  ORF Transcript_24159/g.41041 Transcript_24159/m.41041 type:complete len:226 (-) Transcript_24159:274-951(-)